MIMIGKIFKTVLNTILVLLVLLGVFVVFSFIPFPGNYRVFTVQSGSMEPTIHTGSMLFVKPAKDYNVGDIVTRRTNDPKITITHRIADKKDDEGRITFKTKGDANESSDIETVNQRDIIGRVFLTVPFMGYPVAYAKTTPGIILLIIIPAVIIIYDEIQKIKKEIANKIAYRKLAEKREENKHTG